MRGAGIRDQSGFTILEVLVYLVFGGLVVGTIHYTVLNSQRAFTEQKSMATVQGSLRNAMMMMVGELQGVSPSGGDLSGFGTNEIEIRAGRGGGVVCGPVPGGSGPTYTLAFETGTFEAETPDSVLILAPHGPGLGDDDWRVLKISSVANADYPCDWTTDVEGGTRLTVAGDTSGVALGSAVRPFRHLAYGLFSADGQWWLGRRLRGAGWETMAGPLLAPADSGLVFRYRDRNGADATAAGDVAAVEILMRARRPGFEARVDSLRTVVAFRG